MQAIVERVVRYPVKGLSGQVLGAVDLAPGGGVPGDRRYGLLAGTAAGDAEAAAGGWRPKSDFLTLMRHEKLAALDAEFDEATATLVVSRGGRPVARGRLDEHLGRMLLEQFFAAYLAGAAPGLPRLVEAAHGGGFTDVDAPFVSILNLASVRDLGERVVKRPVDPRRFRANLWLDGLAPWAERGRLGHTLVIGDARLEIVEPIGRCAATEVDPATGARDLSIVRTLRAAYGHTACGVYARVVAGGRIAPGDTVAIEPPAV